jgi:hypothetical protein
MIEYGVVVNGKYATVAYVNDDWQPCHKDVATMAKAHFDDASMIAILRLRPPPNESLIAGGIALCIGCAPIPP